MVHPLHLRPLVGSLDPERFALSKDEGFVDDIIGRGDDGLGVSLNTLHLVVGQVSDNCNVCLSEHIEDLIAHFLFDDDDAGLDLSEFLLDDLYPIVLLVDETLDVGKGSFTSHSADALFEEEYGGVFDARLHAFVGNVLAHDDSVDVLRP